MRLDAARTSACATGFIEFRGVKAHPNRQRWHFPVGQTGDRQRISGKVRRKCMSVPSLRRPNSVVTADCLPGCALGNQRPFRVRVGGGRSGEATQLDGLRAGAVTLSEGEAIRNVLLRVAVKIDLELIRTFRMVYGTGMFPAME